MADDTRSEQDIVREFNNKRYRLNATFQKVAELSAEEVEHDMVIKALADMDPGRKCWRLVGEVLVERTVGEVLPAVKKNKEGIEQALAVLQQHLKAQQKDLSDYQAKYKIRVRNASDVEDDEQQQQKPAGAADAAASSPSKGAAPAQGVLVSSSAKS